MPKKTKSTNGSSKSPGRRRTRTVLSKAMRELRFHPVHIWLKANRLSVVWLAKEAEINRSQLHFYFHWLPEENRFERAIGEEHAGRIARAMSRASRTLSYRDALALATGRPRRLAAV